MSTLRPNLPHSGRRTTELRRGLARDAGVRGGAPPSRRKAAPRHLPLQGRIST